MCLCFSICLFLFSIPVFQLLSQQCPFWFRMGWVWPVSSLVQDMLLVPGAQAEDLASGPSACSRSTLGALAEHPPCACTGLRVVCTEQLQGSSLLRAGSHRWGGGTGMAPVTSSEAVSATNVHHTKPAREVQRGAGGQNESRGHRFWRRSWR